MSFTARRRPVPSAGPVVPPQYECGWFSPSHAESLGRVAVYSIVGSDVVVPVTHVTLCNRPNPYVGTPFARDAQYLGAVESLLGYEPVPLLPPYPGG